MLLKMISVPDTKENSFAPNYCCIRNFWFAKCTHLKSLPQLPCTYALLRCPCTVTVPVCLPACLPANPQQIIIIISRTFFHLLSPRPNCIARTYLCSKAYYALPPQSPVRLPACPSPASSSRSRQFNNQTRQVGGGTQYRTRARQTTDRQL